MRNAGRVLTRGQLIDRVWGADYVGDTKTLDVHVKRLRAKIEPDPSAPRHLVTVRGSATSSTGPDASSGVVRHRATRCRSTSARTPCICWWSTPSAVATPRPALHEARCASPSTSRRAARRRGRGRAGRCRRRPPARRPSSWGARTCSPSPPRRCATPRTRWRCWTAYATRPGSTCRCCPAATRPALTFLAVRRWLGWSAGHLLVLDIGGGSLEMAAGRDEAPAARAVAAPGCRPAARGDWFTADPPDRRGPRTSRVHRRALAAGREHAARRPGRPTAPS